MKRISKQEAIDLLNATELLSQSQQEVLQKERLRELVKYAKEHSPLFTDLYESIDPDNFELSDLPITFKKHLMNRQNEWFTNPSLNVDKVEKYLKSEERLTEPLLGEYSVLKTSGSSGKPLIMVRDSYHNIIHSAMLQCRLLRGLDPNLLSPVHHRLASVIYTKGNVSTYSSFLSIQKASGEFGKNMIAISIMEPISEIVRILNEFKPDVLTGYPSILISLANEQRLGHLNLKLELIASSAEKLSVENYHIISDSFDCRVINNYCSTEGGEIAMSSIDGQLHVNSDWIILEPVDAQNNPIMDGNWSTGVLVTDLTNYIQPIIRYYVEDQLRITKSCIEENKLPIVEIRGRDNDPVSIGNVNISSIGLYGVLYDITGLLRYQFIQQSPDLIEFRGELAPSADKEVVKSEIFKIYNNFMQKNHGTHIRLEIINELPIQNKHGGKAKEFINNCNK